MGDVIGYTVPLFDVNNNERNKNITVGQLFEFKGDKLWNN